MFANFTLFSSRITKDIKEHARDLRNGDGSPLKDDTFMSSTRRKRKSMGNSTIQCSPWEYMACYVRDILPDHGWKVKRNTIKELDVWVASLECGKEYGQEGPIKWVGYDEIIEGAFIRGFYEEFVVNTDNGREYLEQA